MPSIELTREQLEATIDAVMIHRINHDGDAEHGMVLAELHLKLENALELWIYGGSIELPVPEHMKKMGVRSWTKECPPHDEGVT